MNQYEIKHLQRIIEKIKEIEEIKEISDLEKAYYLYRSLGEIYQYNTNFKYFNHNTEEEIKVKRKLYEKETSDNGEAICRDMNTTFVEGLKMLGYKAHIFVWKDKIPHIDSCFMDKSGNWYFANLTADIMHIKTRMKVRNFGLSQNQLKETQLYKRFGLNYLLKMNEENDGQEFTPIPEEQLKQWDDETGYTYHGMYTNEILEILYKEGLDNKFISEFFGTNKKDELVQEKLEFIMKKIGIINNHIGKTIGDIEVIDYYKKIIKKIFTQDEKDCIDFYQAFLEEDEIRKPSDIIVIKKQTENVYYVYNDRKQIFENISLEQLKKSSIKYHNIEEDKGDILVLIKRLEDRFCELDR